MRLHEPEKLAEDFDRRVDRLRDRSTVRRRCALQWFLVFLAVLSAWFVLFFAGSLAGEQREEAAQSVVAEALPEDEVGRSAEGLLGESPVLEEEPEEVPGFDAEALEDKLEEIVGEYEGVYGVSVLEPDSGTRVSLRSDEEFVAASIGKLPPFAALYAAAARGEVDLEEEISIRDEDVQSYGSGSLHGLPVGHSLSLREVAYRLVNHSDNTAWAMLDRRLGKAEIGSWLESMGIEDSSYYGHASGFYTTPDDVLILLERISDARFTDEDLSVEMLEAMTETSVEDRIPERLPENVDVAHKTGSYEGNFGDAGVVFYKDSQGEARRYYLAVLSEGTGEYEARDVIQRVSLAVYEAISGTTVDPEWSRGFIREEAESVPGTSPAPQPASAENSGRLTESVQTAKPPPVEKPTQRPSEGRYNAVPAPRPAPQPSKPASPPYPATREPAYYREEPGYWGEAYWEES